MLAAGIMCISVSRSVVADISKYHYIHHYLEITAVIRPATRLHIIAVFLLTDSHVMQLAQAEPRRHAARRAGVAWADTREPGTHVAFLWAWPCLLTNECD